MKNNFTDHFSQEFDLNDKNLIAFIDELPLWSAPFGLTLLDTVNIRKGMKVLDIGFGTGFPLIELAQRLGTASNVFGIELWENALERAKQKVLIYGLNNIELIYGTAEKLPFEDNYFDLIVSNNGINNVENPERVLNECFRVSKLNAQLVFTLNLPETMKEFYDIFRAVLIKLDLKDEVNKIQEHIFSKRKPIEFIREIINSSGFQIKNEITKSFYLRFADGTSFFNHFLIRLGFLKSWQNIVPQNMIKVTFESIENELNIYAQKKGELSFEIPYTCFDCKKELKNE